MRSWYRFVEVDQTRPLCPSLEDRMRSWFLSWVTRMCSFWVEVHPKAEVGQTRSLYQLVGVDHMSARVLVGRVKSAAQEDCRETIWHQPQGGRTVIPILEELEGGWAQPEVRMGKQHQSEEILF